MLFHPTNLAGAYVIEPERNGDHRGFFARTFCRREFEELHLDTEFVQANNSLSVEKGTLRGMHYQQEPFAETKLVRCIQGAMWDCIIDLRPQSPTFRQWFGEELSAENRLMMYVPKGFAHGFLTLDRETEALYLVDAFYAPESERVIRWDDPAFGIDWPSEPVVLSDKDRTAADFNPDYHLQPAKLS